MKREIKFRAWVPKGYTRWGGGGLVMLTWEDLLNDLHSELNPRKSVMGLGMSHAEEGVVFMQFIGLKDKNGKEIYEGDLLKTPDSKDRFEVMFSRGAFIFSNRDSGKITNSIIPNLWARVEECEIIGNVWENPELLTL